MKLLTDRKWQALNEALELSRKQLREKDITLQGVRAYNEKLFNENLDLSMKAREQEALRVSQVRCQAERADKLQEQNQDLRHENEVYRNAFNALAVGQGLSPERMLELARQATKIQHDLNRSCSLSYELYAAQICNEADRILPKLNEQEAKFFQAVLGGDYTPPHERGKDWQTEHEIRQELYREMYGKEDPHEDEYGDDDLEEGRKLDRGEGNEQERQQEQGGQSLCIGF